MACVKAGRWGAARAFSREAFHASPRVRHSKNAGIEARAAMGGGLYSDQGRVWAAVDEDLALHGVASATRSHAETYRRRIGDIESLTARVHPVEGQRGVFLISAREAVVSALVVGASVVHLAAVWPPAGAASVSRVRLNRPSRRGGWFGGGR